MEKAELKRQWLEGTCFFLWSLGLGGKKTKQDYNVYFSVPGSSRKDAFNVIRTGGEVWFQKHFGKILEDEKIFASHFKCESAERIWPWVDYLSAQANGADGGKRKRVKAGYINFFSLLIWDWGSEWWQLAPVASESCLAAGSWGSSAAAVIPTAPLSLVSLTLLSPYSVMKLFCLKVVHIQKYRYSYYAINSL